MNPQKRKLIEEFWNHVEFCKVSDAVLMQQLSELQRKVADALYDGDLQSA